MDIQKEKEAFEKEMLDTGYVIGNISAFWDEKNQNYDIAITELRMAWYAWQAAKAQTVPKGFVLVERELPESIAETMALERVSKPHGETDPVWVEITEKVYREHLVSKKWELWRDYKAMIEAQEPTNDS